MTQEEIKQNLKKTTNRLSFLKLKGSNSVYRVSFYDDPDISMSEHDGLFYYYATPKIIKEIREKLRNDRNDRTPPFMKTTYEEIEAVYLPEK